MSSSARPREEVSPVARRTRGNPLALAVLALLWERPMHPYEMSMTLRERRKDESVRLNFGSLYSVVDSLVTAGLIEAGATEREGNRPTRTVYRITAAGVTEASEWMRDLVGTPAKEFPAFEAALSFLPLLGPDDVARLLRLRASALRERLAGMASALGEAEAQGLPEVFAVEAHYERAMLEAELAFVGRLEHRITTGELGGVHLWRELSAQAGPDGRIDPAALDALVASFQDATTEPGEGPPG
jgi:DNA-binding PadR family transcriptional regulator